MIMLAASLVTTSGILALNRSFTLISCPYNIGTWLRGHDMFWRGILTAVEPIHITFS